MDKSGNCIGVVSEFVDKLRCLFHSDRVPSADTRAVSEVLSGFKYFESDWRPFVHFDKKRYTRNLVALDEKFSLLVLCWEPEQESPIHAHDESCCWMRVLDGELKQTAFSSSKKPLKKSTLPAGHVYQCNPETVGLHRVSNASGRRVVSLHVYSPPYLECTDQDVTLPVTYCHLTESQREQQEQLKLQLKVQRAVYSNFQVLTELLRQQIGDTWDIPAIKKMIETFQLNPREYKQYVKWDHCNYTRNLVSYDEHFTLMLICWSPGQMSPIHDHSGSSCWVKVLEGELTEVVYDVEGGELRVLSESTLLPDSVAYIDDSIGVHKMGNANTQMGAVTLHCYAPPYQQCRCFDPATGQTRIASMAVVCPSMQALAEPDVPLSPQEVLQPGALMPITSVPALIDNIKELFATDASPPLHRISDVMHSFQFNPSEWQQYAHFDKFRYTRNLLGYNDNFSLIMICWNTTQCSPLHVHDRSAVWVKVLQGELTLSQHVGGVKRATKVTTLLTDSVTYFDAHVGLHKTENRSATQTAISLHLYSPPYLECAGEDFVVPVVYCSSVTCGNVRSSKPACSLASTGSTTPRSGPHTPRSDPQPHLSDAQLTSSDDESSHETQPDEPTDDLELELKCKRMVFTNLQSLVDQLRKEFASLPPGEQPDEARSAQITRIVESMQFNPK
eukprot:TRINITY_DN8284_c0_g1_i2.p1 TRINITY_DN8284_c0_g1~~TRINITY_DN8284_c0_g1_i2.p1  ORF type:complete len:673 (-),score=239.38 TRINITY_DN8284_c0_g1_i2:165-2183(-)